MDEVAESRAVPAADAPAAHAADAPAAHAADAPAAHAADVMVPRIVRVRKRARDLPGTVTLGAGTGRRRTPAALPSGPVHHALRVRRRRNSRQHQRRCRRPRAAGADHPLRWRGQRSGHRIAARRYAGITRPVRQCMADRGAGRTGRGSGGRRARPGTAAPVHLSRARQPLAVRQSGAVVRHAQPRRDPVPPTIGDLAQTPRPGDRRDGGPRRAATGAAMSAW